MSKASGSNVRPNPFSVTVPTSHQSDGRNPHTIYVLVVQWDAKLSYSVERRFSEFEDLRAKLVEFVENIPPLPGKTLLRTFDSSFIESRRAALDSWIRAVLAIEFVVKSSMFAYFLQVDVHVGPDVIGKHAPSEIKCVNDPQFGINALSYDDANLVLFTACEDVHILSRIDRQLSNLRLPWEKSGGLVPVGSMACWAVDDQGDWKTRCVVYYPVSASSILWLPATNSLWVGLDNGHTLHYRADDKYENFTLLSDIEAHTLRVTGMAFSAVKNVVLSVSRDKNLVLFSNIEKKVTHTIPISNAWLTSLTFDSQFDRFFIGTYSGSIYIYTMTPYPAAPSVLHTLTGHTGPVKALHFAAPERLLFSGGGDCTTGIWSIHPSASQETSRSRSAGWMAAGPQKKVKSVIYCPSLRQVVTGVEGGWFCVWHTSNGKLSYVVKGHSDNVVALSWIDTPRILISASADGKVKFWRFESPVEDELEELSDEIAAQAYVASSVVTEVPVEKKPVVAPQKITSTFQSFNSQLKSAQAPTSSSPPPALPVPAVQTATTSAPAAAVTPRNTFSPTFFSSTATKAPTFDPVAASNATNVTRVTATANETTAAPKPAVNAVADSDEPFKLTIAPAPVYTSTPITVVNTSPSIKTDPAVTPAQITASIPIVAAAPQTQSDSHHAFFSDQPASSADDDE